MSSAVPQSQKKLEKEAKLAAKQLKQAASTLAGEKKAKAVKDKKTEEPAFVNTTPKGEKKGGPLSLVPALFLTRSRA